MSEDEQLNNSLNEINEAIITHIEPLKHFIIHNFSDMDTIIIHLDLFVALLEMNKESEKYEYVALGKINVNNRVVQIVDLRLVSSDILTPQAINSFKGLIDGNEPTITRSIEGKWPASIILQQVMDTWSYMSEYQQVVVH